MGRYRRRLQPSMGEFKRMVGLVVSTEAKMSIIEILNAIRSRCPEWTVTPCRVRKALTALQHAEAKRGDAPQASCRIYPHDVVELRPGSRKQKLRRMWRGQVYRVSGYDDGASSDEELPPGRCSVSWIGDNLHQTPGLRMKESALQLIDRPFVIGDRVSAVQDPRSLGLVVDVRCTCRFSRNPPPSRPYPEVSADRVHAVGGFRMEEVIAHDESRWIGRIIDALFRVEVEIMKRCEGRKGRSKLGKCVFQVSSEGLTGLTPLDDSAADQACAQELCPHFPGQQVRAPPRVWRQAEWLEDCSQLSRKRTRGPPICGEVTSVSCEMLGVHWGDAWSSKAQMPPEWVHPSTIRRLSMNNCPSEGWLLGEHCQAWEDPSAPCAVLTRTTTHTTVKWADDVEEDILAVDLMPRQAFYSHDFLPHDYVARTADVDRFDPRRAETLQPPGPNDVTQDESVQYGSTQEEMNEDCRHRELFATFLGQVNEEDIIPTETPAGPPVPIGVVKSVDLKARTALVEWRCTLQDNPQEVSLFELAPHPFVDVRLADVVFIPPDQQSQDSGAWVGRVTAFSGFSAQVQLACGSSEWFDVQALRIADMDCHYESSVSSEEDAVNAGSIEEEFQEVWGRSRAASQSLDEDAEAPEEECEHCEQPQSETSEGSSSSTRAPEILAFDVLQEDLSPLDHKFVDRPSPPPKVLMRAVRREHSVLQKGLLDGGEGVVAPIAVRTYSSRCDLFRAMVVGPPGTPYSDVPFFFDMSLSPQYPAEPPLVHFMASYVSSCEKLNPNLYNDGKVCLSILGTWAGPGWDPQKSTLLQVLISLQGLVLVEDPYFNEPGHEWECNSEHGRNASALYNENVRLLVLRAALNVSKHPPSGFEEIVASHFARHGPRLLAECEEALLEVNAHRTSEGFRKVLARNVVPGLRDHWGNPSSPPL